MSGQSFHLKLKQTQQLNQGLQQSLRVLQMSGIELEREVDDWLQDNPLLERREPADDGVLEPARLSAAVSSRNQIGGDEAEDVWATIAEEEDFNRYLHNQVCEHPLSDEEAARIHILIDFLDDQGYLTDSMEEIIDHTPLEWMLDEDDMHDALEKLQSFDPPGVGAADLRESLLIQLQRLPASAERRCAGKIVNRFLDELNRSSRRNIAKFKKELPDYPSDTIEAALDLITTLNPYPAYGFASAEPTSFVQPDVFVREGEHGWEVSGNEHAWPSLVLNSELADALKEDGIDEVWREKIQEARQKIDSLELRKNTVSRLAEYIVAKQEDFFDFGEIGLTPMLMKDAAAALGLAESTVSRAAGNKYLACPRGLFPLRYFFTQAVNSGEGQEGNSQTAVKAVLAQLIENEDKAAPHSDEALAALLKLQGIDIARRTVAKYREALGLPPAHQRKI
ncbi:RNA polymerase factor sigma-54 [Kingella potus]|uniref:RNA polymerase sigma-54 factor n=1 Tax=Kingella potus TaxID=265175 RepID=A0A377R197_9NEIS|nr:RNA polymerase factor sigma-54 [Kingella potus]STR00770.1 RNA polymerase factor sigma-54 [Kingella potus]